MQYCATFDEACNRDAKLTQHNAGIDRSLAPQSLLAASTKPRISPGALIGRSSSNLLLLAQLYTRSSPQHAKYYSVYDPSVLLAAIIKTPHAYQHCIALRNIALCIAWHEPQRAQHLDLVEGNRWPAHRRRTDRLRTRKMMNPLLYYQGRA